MKTIIELDIPDLSNTAELCDAVERNVSQRIVDEIKEDAKNCVREIIVKTATAQIEQVIQGAIDLPVKLTSMYGERRHGDAVTLREHIMALAKEHIEGKVNPKTGVSHPGYRDGECPRIEWMIRDAVARAVAEQMKAIEAEVKSQATGAMVAWLKGHVGEAAEAARREQE